MMIFMQNPPRRKYDWLNAWTIAVLSGPLVWNALFIVSDADVIFRRIVIYLIEVIPFLVACFYLFTKKKVPVYSTPRKILQIMLNIFLTLLSAWTGLLVLIFFIRT